MKILVTGVGGQLGFDVMNELAKRGHEGIVCEVFADVYRSQRDGIRQVSQYERR